VPVEGRVWSSTPVTHVRIYHNGKVWKDVPVPPGSLDMRLSEKAQMAASGWFSLSLKPRNCLPYRLDPYAPAVTDAVRVHPVAVAVRIRTRPRL